MAVKFSYSRIFFTLSFILVLYLFYRMLKPFLVAVILALTLVSLFYPNYLQLNRKLRGHSGLSSIIMCTIITILIIIPSVLFFIALFHEFNSAYQTFKHQLVTGELKLNLPGQDNALLQEMWQRFGRYMGVGDMDLTRALSSLVDRFARFLLEHYSAILGGIGTFVSNFFVMIFSMFFFFRDGSHFLRELKALVPLEPRYEDMVVEKLKQVTFATFFGMIATGICQGIAAGLIFLALGIGSPVLWGTATAFFSLVPIVGTATVWVPLSVYLIVTGSAVRGIILLILGAAVIGMVDNLVRPLIIEGRSEGVHLLLVFFSLLGGFFLFGPAGLVLGPLVVALLVTFLTIYKIEFKEDLGD